MKKMKKLLSMLLAVVMVLAMAAPGFAAETTGTITIENVTKDYEYAVYKLFDANPSGPANGESKDAPIAYTATKQQVQLMLGLEDEDPGNVRSNDYFKFSKTTTGDYNVESVNDDNEAVINYLKTFFSSNTDPQTKKTTWTPKVDGLFTLKGTKTADSDDANATIVFSELPFGYYFVTSSLGTTLTITSTNKNATVLDKNQGGPSWGDDDKDNGKGVIEVNDSDAKVPSNPEDSNSAKVPAKEISASFGDIVTFQVKFNTTNYDADNKRIENYYITDILAKGMEYNNLANMQVFVGSTKLDENEYSVSNITKVESTEETTFTVTIPWYEKNAQDVSKGSFKYVSPNTITIIYDAKVKDTAEIAGTGNTNKAKFNYNTLDPDGKPNDPEKGSEEKTVTTYVYALGIKKTDPSGNPLSGAKFTLTNANGINIQLKEVSSGVYNYVSASNTEDASVIESPESGMIVINGVKAEEYLLKETAAPAGYNLLLTEEKIIPVLKETYSKKYKIEYTTKEGVTTTNIIPLDETAEVQESDFNADVPVKLINVINNRGTMLPATGGIGTTIFYAAGIILMAGAVFFVVRRKRA